MGSRFNYAIHQKINFYAGLDFSISRFDIVINKDLDNFFNDSHQIEPKIGIKFLLGSKTKQQ